MRSTSMYLYKHFLALLLCMIVIELNANVTLPGIFSDDMVLQQQSEVRIWGWAKALEPVTVTASWLDLSAQTKADNLSNWSVTLQTPPAGGPFTIEIRGYNTITLHNVMSGEVWLCSGQSNMEWTPRAGIDNGEREIAAADHPDIRFISIDYRTATTPQIDVHSDGWKVCTPSTMKDFSAVGYFFGRAIQEDLGVPIGLINSSWGGTPAEAWTDMQHADKPFIITDAAQFLPDVPWGPEEPGVIYNAMVNGLSPYRIAGALWYQGEANTPNPQLYASVFAEMIGSWRNAWGYQFPFYYVQIAPYEGYSGNSGVLVRDAQRRVLDVPETGMVVTSDIGNLKDIHPRNKIDVGKRLAELALHRHYNTVTGYDSGPLYKSMSVNGNMVTIQFDFADGLRNLEDEISGFEIAGNDGKYYPATARIVQRTVVLSSTEVNAPVAARYAWSNSAEPKLINKTGMPASSFNTSDAPE